MIPLEHLEYAKINIPEYAGDEDTFLDRFLHFGARFFLDRAAQGRQYLLTREAEAALEELRPRLKADGGDCQIVEVEGDVVRVRMTIKPGGFDDASQGWTGGYATRSSSTGSVYLNCEFVVTDGEFARRKMWSLIGLHSPKDLSGPTWAAPW